MSIDNIQIEDNGTVYHTKRVDGVSGHRDVYAGEDKIAQIRQEYRDTEFVYDLFRPDESGEGFGRFAGRFGTAFSALSYAIGEHDKYYLHHNPYAQEEPLTDISAGGGFTASIDSELGLSDEEQELNRLRRVVTAQEKAISASMSALIDATKTYSDGEISYTVERIADGFYFIPRPDPVEGDEVLATFVQEEDDDDEWQVYFFVAPGKEKLIGTAASVELAAMLVITHIHFDEHLSDPVEAAAVELVRVLRDSLTPEANG